ncbi:unnamed protein product [Musa acuminata var. zebrina]
MGGSETDCKGAKTSATQEQPPAASSSPGAAVYPDWSGFQAYSPVLPHGFFHSPVVSSPQSHPYMWGAQHLMPHYGTPPPPYVMYPHGIYAHPSMPPGSHPFSPYAMTPPNGNAEACGSVPASTGGDAKSSEGKERNPIQRSKGSLGSLNMITGKNNNELDKGPANGVFSRSGDSESEGSSEGSDTNSHNDSEPKTGDGQGPLDETSLNGTSGVITAPSHQMMPIMPMLAAGVPAAVAGPTTNLNIGMDYWVAPTPSVIPPVRGKVPATTNAGATIPGTLVGSSEKVPSEIWLQDERELKRQRRKQSNRESARRSRLRKQAEYEELAQRVEVLKEENTALRAEVDRIKKEYDELLSQNTALQKKIEEKTKEDAIVEMNRQQAKDKNLDSDPQAGQLDGKHSGVMDRNRKREAIDGRSQEKRACSSSEFRPCSSTSSSLPPPPPQTDSEMESSSSGRSDRAGDSGYGSCDSDDFAGGYDSRNLVGRGRLQRVFSGLLDDGSGGSAQLAALTELCEVLSFCMEDAVGYFPLETVVPPLVKLASHESSPDVMLLAIRALTYLCDAMPRSAEAIVRHGALPVLCGRLLAIEYLDVAEQSLQALEKISRKQPVPCLQAGTIAAVLTYIDFFPTNPQRVAVSTVANVCKKLPPDCSTIVIESVPILCSLLQYEDHKLVETVAACLVRITDCFAGSSELLDELCKHGIIQKSLNLIANDGHRSLSRATYSGLIGLLRKLATSSLVAVQTLFELNISRTLMGILMSSDMLRDSAYMSVQDMQTNQVYEVLKLANQLIPPVLRDVPDDQIELAKEKILVDQPNFLHEFSTDILPVSVQVVNSGANAYVCYACVSIINSIAYFSTPDILLDSIKSTNISSFLAGLLSRKDPHVLFLTLKTVEVLMQKLPAVFLSSFIKEGVVYAIDAALLVQEKCSDSVSEHSNDHMVVRDTSRCMCHAFNSSRVSASESKTCRLQKDSIQSLARHIKTTYFTHEAVDSEMGFTETLQKLKILCTVLNDNVDSCSTSDGCLQNEENLTQILLQVMREFSEGESMSTFEFIESGIARFLSCYLSNGKYLSGTTSAIDLSSHTLTVLKRFQIFSSICLSNPGQSWDNMLLAVLLKKFQNALSSLDNFPVILSHGFKLRNTYTDIPVRGITKNPCLRVRFVRQNEDTNLSDLDNVVNVDISSSFDALEGYLWPKVNKGKNGHRTESADRKADDTTSGIKHVSEKNPIETHTNISQESCISNSAEVSRQEEQYLPAVDSSPKQTMSAKEVTEGSSASPSIGSAKPKLTFSLRGKQLDSSMTIYQAVLEEQKGAEFDMVVGSKFWSEVYKLTYKSAEPKANDSEMLNCVPQSSVFWNKHGFSDWKYPFLLAELPCKIDKLNASYDVLFMLKIFEGMNHYLFQLLSDERLNAFAEGRIENFDDLKVIVSSIPQVEFVNSKLNDKLEQQMQDPLVLTTGCMPSWCGQLMAACPFLFSFEARRKYFYLTTFGSLRSQQNNIQNLDGSGTNSLNDRHSYSGSLRKKFIVNRNNILESAVKMMKLHAQSKGTLEVEYAEEVGTGLGPTMEFFTLASHEFQKVGLGMWRGDLSYAGRSTIDGYSEFVLAPFGLFPRPWSTSTDVSGVAEFPEVIKMFLLLGKLVAKAIKDGRILDIPFSRAFYKIILEQELSICDIQSIDPELGRTMLEFQALVNRKRFLESISGDSSNLCYRNTSVKDLCLDFTLPGFPDYPLLSESTKMVNIVNLEEYVTMVVDATIGSGISRQIDAFKSGFNEVFSLKALQIFTKDELERLLCGEQDCWDFTELVDHINFDHGYTGSSPTVVSFLEIIQELERDQRRAFLQFVTGSPRLPPGGLAALKPKLTVVRKHSSCDADMDLPSVMTCANYLKLPPYSSKEKMRHKLLYAITEGQGSFHLS